MRPTAKSSLHYLPPSINNLSFSNSNLLATTGTTAAATTTILTITSKMPRTVTIVAHTWRHFSVNKIKEKREKLIGWIEKLIDYVCHNIQCYGFYIQRPTQIQGHQNFRATQQKTTRIVQSERKSFAKPLEVADEWQAVPPYYVKKKSSLLAMFNTTTLRKIYNNPQYKNCNKTSM